MIAGRYALEREIGRGGMGAVWLGRDEVLGRPVAMKRIGLLPGADGTDLERAEREARMGAGLAHPHVVAIFDLVSDGEDRWLVMEYVEGSTLAELVRTRGALSPDAAGRLLGHVAEALVAAQGAGIIHRDVKPSNIMVDRNGTAKLSDFGIARRTGDASLTQTGLLIGSPTYLAPEVASGSSADAASDAWSFGATLYFALTGGPPYEIGDNLLSALYRIVHEDPPPVPEAAGWLAPVLAGTLLKDPDQRWSMGRVLDFLGGGTQTRATVVPPAQQVTDPDATEVIGTAAARSPRRHVPVKLLALAAALLTVVVVLAVVLATRGPGSPTPEAGPTTPLSSPTSSPTSSPSGSPSPAAAPTPTAAGMKAFIRDYVSTVSSDPRKAWTMLTPGFQRESGGLQHYVDFWRPARNGRVLSITANPDNLSVSYHVHFDHFHNGPGPTVLDLVLSEGHYRIDNERTRGFQPAG